MDVSQEAAMVIPNGVEDGGSRFQRVSEAQIAVSNAVSSVTFMAEVTLLSATTLNDFAGKKPVQPCLLLSADTHQDFSRIFAGSMTRDVIQIKH